MTTIKMATARHPPMGPINPPNEFASRERRRGLFATSITWLCASAGTMAATSANCSSPMLIVALGATTEVACTAGATNDPDLTTVAGATKALAHMAQRARITAVNFMM